MSSPLFWMVIVYSMVSPGFRVPPLRSTPVLVATSSGAGNSIAVVTASGKYWSPFVLRRRHAFVVPFGSTLSAWMMSAS